MARDPEAIIADIEFGQDRLHAKWWEIACWLADNNGIAATELSPDQKIAYAAHIRELTDNWQHGATAPVGRPLNATTDLHRMLAEYYELTEQLGGFYAELDTLVEAEN